MADDELGATLRKIGNRARIAYASPRAMAESGADVPRLRGAVEAALRFHERTALYGNAATDDEPDACPHDPDSPLHFEDGDGSGEWLCEGRPEGAACSTCAEDGERMEWPCPEYAAILAALTGKGNDDG